MISASTALIDSWWFGVGAEDGWWLCCTSRTYTKGAWSWRGDEARHHCLRRNKNITARVTVSEAGSFKDSVHYITRRIIGNGNSCFAVLWKTYLLQWSLNSLNCTISYYLF